MLYNCQREKRLSCRTVLDGKPVRKLHHCSSPFKGEVRRGMGYFFDTISMLTHPQPSTLKHPLRSIKGIETLEREGVCKFLQNPNRTRLDPRAVSRFKESLY